MSRPITTPQRPLQIGLLCHVHIGCASHAQRLTCAQRSESCGCLVFRPFNTQKERSSSTHVFPSHRVGEYPISSKAVKINNAGSMRCAAKAQSTPHARFRGSPSRHMAKRPSSPHPCIPLSLGRDWLGVSLHESGRVPLQSCEGSLQEAFASFFTGWNGASQDGDIRACLR